MLFGILKKCIHLVLILSMVTFSIESSWAMRKGSTGGGTGEDSKKSRSLKLSSSDSDEERKTSKRLGKQVDNRENRGRLQLVNLSSSEEEEEEEELWWGEEDSRDEDDVLQIRAPRGNEDRFLSDHAEGEGQSHREEHVNVYILEEHAERQDPEVRRFLESLSYEPITRDQALEINTLRHFWTHKNLRAEAYPHLTAEERRGASDQFATALTVITPPDSEGSSPYSWSQSMLMCRAVNQGFVGSVTHKPHWVYRIFQVGGTLFFGLATPIAYTQMITFAAGDNTLHIAKSGPGEIIPIAFFLGLQLLYTPRQFWRIGDDIHRLLFRKKHFKVGDSRGGQPHVFQTTWKRWAGRVGIALITLADTAAPLYVYFHGAQKDIFTARTIIPGIGLAISLFDLLFRSGLRRERRFWEKLHWGPPKEFRDRKLLIRRASDMRERIIQNNGYASRIASLLQDEFQRVRTAPHEEEREMEELWGGIGDEFERSNHRAYEVQEAILNIIDYSVRMEARRFQQRLADPMQMMETLLKALGPELEGTHNRYHQVQEAILAKISPHAQGKVREEQKGKFEGKPLEIIPVLLEGIQKEIESCLYRKRFVQRKVLKLLPRPVLEAAKKAHDRNIAPLRMTDSFTELSAEIIRQWIEIHLNGGTETEAMDGDVFDKISFLLSVLSKIGKQKTKDLSNLSGPVGKDVFGGDEVLYNPEYDYRKIPLNKEKYQELLKAHLETEEDDFDKVYWLRTLLGGIGRTKTSKLTLGYNKKMRVQKDRFIFRELAAARNPAVNPSAIILDWDIIESLIQNDMKRQERDGHFKFELRGFLLEILNKIQKVKTGELSSNGFRIRPDAFTHQKLAQRKNKQIISIFSALMRKNPYFNKVPNDPSLHLDRPQPSERRVEEEDVRGEHYDEWAPLLEESSSVQMVPAHSLHGMESEDDDDLGIVQLQEKVEILERKKIDLESQLEASQFRATNTNYNENDPGAGQRSTWGSFSRATSQAITWMSFMYVALNLFVYEELASPSSSSRVGVVTGLFILSMFLWFGTNIIKFPDIDKAVSGIKRFFSRDDDVWGLRRAGTLTAFGNSGLLSLVRVSLAVGLLQEVAEDVEDPTLNLITQSVGYTFIGAMGLNDLSFYQTSFDDAAQETISASLRIRSFENTRSLRGKRAHLLYLIDQWIDFLRDFDEETNRQIFDLTQE